MLVGTGPAGWVGNIVLVGQPQIGEGHIPWPKYWIKWDAADGRKWKKQQWKMQHDMAGTYLPYRAPRRSAISAIDYTESSDWKVGTETISVII